ncbi:bifunctional GNAT family N-acetyltransferase/carbon-nitrogen hydrolase family protein [Pseudodesulfovibrio sp. S3-i]|uniref:bifunctional GNAT family N-acetyltransferase/carbon-nitrogen hydrolase family protein n=1 Tax=Pseudodesulfovibrio sp. S3-i TaxID=2929474 RepID=UPI001FB98C87|nr:bifunctional GNAT family N-acetyltransferase/carbon-nitrogen hydrolase family protein [Pseudodesulfovibrio sp. S3-i]MCJ2166283.1 bifunctional GNAT family N-acetyltransferase/carbon-nitrogen hydrolase family protein [Pseudodesulfovibrio sp. S3-i]
MSGRKTVKVRNWTEEDIPAIVACQRAAYPDFEEHYDERMYAMQFAAFPEGQILAEVDGEVIGYATSIIVLLDEGIDWYRYEEITGGGSFSTHTPTGDTLYGADIAVHPDYRGKGVAGKIYSRRKRIMKRYNLSRMIAHGRIMNYNEQAGKLTAREYVDMVEKGELKDSALNAHLKAGYRVKGVFLDLLQDDSSLNYSTFLEMPNPDFQPVRRKIAGAPLKRAVRQFRVCAAQYQMRKITSWEELRQSVEFFVVTANTYHCHFLVLPELFTAQMFSAMPPEWDSRRAVRELAGMTDQYLDMFRELATQYNLHIIGGSHPVLREGKLYNVAHLFTPTGNVYTQDKLHITPGEREEWGIHPGEGLSVFQTSLGRIAIQVCYDIEFPEVSRLLALAGAEVIFVPFSTDEKRAYMRVRATAQARAIENSIYTVIAANVGNLYGVRTYLLNYGQSAVFAPSDFAFPIPSLSGEADPGVETVVIADLDFASLSQVREFGSVRPLHERRTDIYDLKPKTKIKIIRTE